MESDNPSTGEASCTGRYIYETPWPCYAVAWSARPEPRVRAAVGSCIEGDTNKIQIVELSGETLTKTAEVEHVFPATKLMWRPCEPSPAASELLASSGTALNIWRVEDRQLKLVSSLANIKRTQEGQSELVPPLTSFDWSANNPHKAGTSSVDTTCTIWNLERQRIESQLIAHDKAVYDIAFGPQGDNLFASVGADGSVRLFDQRNLEHSTIIYEASPAVPLLRLAWKRANMHHIATMAMDVPGVIVIDVRRPSLAFTFLSLHDACVNDIAWSPTRRDHLLCGADDGSAFVLDMKQAASKPDHVGGDAPMAFYEVGHEVYQVDWITSQNTAERVGIGTARHVELLHV
mmetsp:Transcript_25414/g.70782  ORF Transcript_25414/g.70782 Transcript_25414/m.70782 type:complete len:347 (+) Transcript_25414:164-1204(+)|eukprot:CAMPEP_0117465290 /NCGR_PEP_ID=MMETSP0784-20121206/4552_1 /TAXON_ID=39447 /ORGANISM="" /LENGTH=346 /DNA_ID=CAMNT_0005259199 /DNA_START=39 /DNA_END=1079 /DNA_ORIENTATION=-